MSSSIFDIILQMRKLFTKYIDTIPYITLILVIVSTLASLYFSEILHLVPCVLCWYQRIAMYSLVPVVTVGILLKDKNFPLYVLPLSTIGLGIAAYHNLLYYHFLPESIAPCTAGVSCTSRFFQIFGFIDIPFGSLVAFTLVNICMIIYFKNLGVLRNK